MRSFAFLLLTFGLILTSKPAMADSQPANVFQIIDFMESLRNYIGTPLLASTVDMVNTTSGLSLQNLTPQGAAFSDGIKKAGETVDQIRNESMVTVAISTCDGADSLDAKISRVSFWEDIPQPQPNQQGPDERAQVALGLQEVLEAMQNPASIQTPGTLRAPSDGFHGLTFEYTNGDKTEALSFLNEDANDPENSLKIEWSVTDTAVCPPH